MRSAVVALAAVLLACGPLACGPKEPEGTAVGVSDKPGPTAPTGEISFVFDSIDDRPVSSASTRGRPVVLAFVTTGDIVCQAQVDYLVAMAKNDGDKVAYALVAMHPRKELVLVETYAKALNVTFPVALSEGPSGPFGEIPAVPTLVLLDRLGRIAWKHTGLAKSDELRAHMHEL